jgi:hypothetical protein
MVITLLLMVMVMVLHYYFRMDLMLDVVDYHYLDGLNQLPNPMEKVLPYHLFSGSKMSSQDR